MSSGWLCCSSKRSLAKSGCCESPNLVLVGSGRWCLWSHLYWEEQHCVSPGGACPSTHFALGGPPHPTTLFPTAIPAASWPQARPSRAPTWPCLVLPPAQTVPLPLGVPIPGLRPEPAPLILRFGSTLAGLVRELPVQRCVPVPVHLSRRTGCMPTWCVFAFSTLCPLNWGF